MEFGKPEVRLDVGAPAIEVVVLLVILLGAGDVAVEADNVAIVGLYPDAADELAGEFIVAGDESSVSAMGVTSKTAVGTEPRNSLRT